MYSKKGISLKQHMERESLFPSEVFDLRTAGIPSLRSGLESAGFLMTCKKSGTKEKKGEKGRDRRGLPRAPSFRHILVSTRRGGYELYNFGALQRGRKKRDGKEAPVVAEGWGQEHEPSERVSRGSLETWKRGRGAKEGQMI